MDYTVLGKTRGPLVDKWIGIHVNGRDRDVTRCPAICLDQLQKATHSDIRNKHTSDRYLYPSSVEYGAHCNPLHDAGWHKTGVTMTIVILQYADQQTHIEKPTNHTSHSTIRNKYDSYMFRHWSATFMEFMN
jgi:hypothetical protein